MAVNFDFDVKTIGKLLKAERMSVPVNQRSYKWEEIHVRNLLQDLMRRFLTMTRTTFLGPLFSFSPVGTPYRFKMASNDWRLLPSCWQEFGTSCMRSA